MRESQGWIGVGVKVGGMLGLVGGEGLVGHIHNVGFPHYANTMTISGLRLGYGLGGGAGLVAIFIFNSNNPFLDFNGKSIEDWELNVSMGEKWDDTLAIIKNYKLFSILRRSKWILAASSAKNISDIRNCMSYLYTLYDLTDTSGPKIVTVDIPFAGMGEELAAYYIAGTIGIGTEQWVRGDEFSDSTEA